MLLMKTLLTSQCINQRGAGDDHLANAAARNRVWLFVLPPEDVLNSAQILIFTPSRKIPFASHPNVGTVLVAPAGGGQGKVISYNTHIDDVKPHQSRPEASSPSQAEPEQT